MSEMAKYRIAITDTDPELEPGETELKEVTEVTEEIGADGYLILTFRDGDPGVIMCGGLTTIELARMIAECGGGSGLFLLEAIEIARGLRKAAMLRKEYMDRRAKVKLADRLEEIFCSRHEEEGD